MGERTRRYEARHRDASGIDLPVMVTRTDLPRRSTGPEGAFVLITDLDGIKALERRLARRVAQLSIVREIGECLQSAMSPERILRTILVGTTASVRASFNRAFLLLVDEHHGVLRGRDAIGPADAGDAQRIWCPSRGHGKDPERARGRLRAGGRGGREPLVQAIARKLSVKMDDEYGVRRPGAYGPRHDARRRRPSSSGAVARRSLGSSEILGDRHVRRSAAHD